MSNEKDPNRELAQQRLNMGKDPGPYYADLSSQYQKQQSQKASESRSSSGGSSSSGSSGSGSGGGCFPSGTMISTPSGDRDIATIQPGDLVFSVDVSAGRCVPCPVLKARAHSARNLWRIGFEDGLQLRTTAIHSFAMEDGWRIAARICPGDKVLFYSSRGAPKVRTVIDSQATREYDDVYNLIVGGHFNFIADGALAHSFTHFRRVRVILWSILFPQFLQNAGALADAPSC